jgi:hypothetical protein
MSRTVTISDELAQRLEERRLETGQGSVDEVATSLMEEALEFDDEFDENCGYTVEELRQLIAEGEASEMTEFRSAAEVSEEVRRRFARKPE